MSKKHNIDFISDLHERADHNINPHYWFNRVTPFTMAQWRTNKYFYSIFFVIYSFFGILWFNSLDQIAQEEGKTLWSLLFDFHDSFTSARFVGVLLFTLYWGIMGIAAIQTIIQIVNAPPVVELKPKKEKKKKYPKRPKNYK